MIAWIEWDGHPSPKEEVSCLDDLDEWASDLRLDGNPTWKIFYVDDEGETVEYACWEESCDF